MSEEQEVKPKKPKMVVPKGDKFLNGLPKRQMTMREWREYPENLRELALKLGIFEVKYD